MLKDIIEYIAKALVDDPEAVQVTEIEGEVTSVIELRVAKTRPWKSNRKRRPHCPRNAHHFNRSLNQDQEKGCPGDY